MFVDQSVFPVAASAVDLLGKDGVSELLVLLVQTLCLKAVLLLLKVPKERVWEPRETIVVQQRQLLATGWTIKQPQQCAALFKTIILLESFFSELLGKNNFLNAYIASVQIVELVSPQD